jgi:hypothetical protein
MRNAYKVSVGKFVGRRPLGRSRCRWEYNVRMDVGETLYEDVNWTEMYQDRIKLLAYLNLVMKVPAPKKAGTILTR